MLSAYSSPGVRGIASAYPVGDSRYVDTLTAAKEIRYVPHEDIHRQIQTLSKPVQTKLHDIVESRLSEKSNQALNNILRHYKEKEIPEEKLSWIQDMFGEYGSLHDKALLKKRSGLDQAEWEEFKQDARRAYNSIIKDLNSRNSREDVEKWITKEHEKLYIDLGDAAESGIAAAKKPKK